MLLSNCRIQAMQWGVPSASSVEPDSLMLANLSTIRHWGIMPAWLDLGQSRL
jgi:hypothetical protein